MLLRILFSFLFIFLFCLAANAQVCTGNLGAPVVNETFGRGPSFNPGPRLPDGLTNLKWGGYNSCGGPDDAGEGVYTIQSDMGTTCKGGTWQNIPHDHTGDKYGYMMIINAGQTPDVFFTEKVDGSKLCAGATYYFGAYVMNILRPLPSTKGFIKPNLTFTIKSASGLILAQVQTGPIPESEVATWRPYGALFNSPNDGSDILIEIKNNAPGGLGNDLALDDITFSPCGPLIQTGFGNAADNAPRQLCEGDSFNYKLVASQTGYTNPLYQWQKKFAADSSWTDIPGATTTTADISVTNALAATYQYRIGILSGSRAGSENCRIYSDPLNVIVNPLPKIVLASTTTICNGYPFKLSASGGASGVYKWTGPNGFSATGDSPDVTQVADASYNGVYTVAVTINGCTAFANTTVSVVQAPSVAPMSDLTICAGSSVQLNAIAANATHYSWSPSTGLDHNDIPNPVATPTETITYTVEVSNDGCTNISPTSQTKITVLKNPVADAGKELKIFEGQTAALNGTATGDNIVRTYWTPVDYLDNPESLTPNTSATNNITYTLHAVSASCGENTSNVFVRVYKRLSIPNTFSPNGDGINDFWNIANLSTYPNSLITVYNRNGTQVYQSRGYSNPWNGLYAGANLPAGTYYYVIDPREDNLPRTSGWIFLVR